ncbi:MAG: entericidin [Bacteroidales bacterium]
MKSFKLFLVAAATVCISALFSCGSGSNDEGSSDSTQVQQEPTVEQTVDSTAAADTLKK